MQCSVKADRPVKRNSGTIPTKNNKRHPAEYGQMPIITTPDGRDGIAISTRIIVYSRPRGWRRKARRWSPQESIRTIALAGRSRISRQRRGESGGAQPVLTLYELMAARKSAFRDGRGT